MSSVTRTSCELQVLDAAIVERIEEAVEKAKVTGVQTLHFSAIFHRASSLNSITTVSFHVGKEELQESACDGEASSPFQSEYLLYLMVLFDPLGLKAMHIYKCLFVCSH